jgi:hypothetical protein
MEQILVTTAAFLVSGIAKKSARCATRGGTDHGALACAARLMADDGTGGSAKQGAASDSALGVRSGGSGAIR